ncbi:hypothetical protein L3081_25910 [Colwellia sp. MSW7]|uniref:Uncharacterized protein n=1 Tax=Colwellia maritima TaxID=2912588 RepID=A0ABS9X7N8_9GAMM|nr:hypothetical protein [Colwellia maritima]MCI2286237.1 hypothetical protein [Colwellia maritima]
MDGNPEEVKQTIVDYAEAKPDERMDLRPVLCSFHFRQAGLKAGKEW